jgi:hypothetical protein
MTDRVKKANRGIPVLQRSQNFTNADASAGDVLMVADSLGYPASHVVIEAQNGAIKVRFNVYQTIYPQRPYDMLLRDDLPNISSGVLLNTASGVTTSTDRAYVNVEGGTTYTLDKMLAVSDIQLDVVSGNFDIFVA